MRSFRRNRVVAGLLALASYGSAQLASVSPSTGVTFKLNIPESTASSGSGDIFFQISAPSSYEWVALGQGTGMSGANIFVVYTAGNGNVTLSPRLGTGHTMPNFNSNAKVTLLEGSGVSGGNMVANVRCSSCNSWSGGSASFSGSNGNWIYAYQSSGGPKDTTDQSASINQHSSESAFRWDYTNAKGGSSVNPLISSGSSSSSGTASGTGSRTGTTTTCVPRPSSTGTAASGASATTSSTGDSQSSQQGRSTQFSNGWTGYPTARPTSRPWDNGKREEKRDNINYCDDNSNAAFTPISSSSAVTREKKMLIAHGTLAALAFVIFFPVGAIAIRLASFTGIVWFHAAFQAFAYLVYIAAFGLGVYIANDYRVLGKAHPIIGIVVLVCLFFQPILGLTHHAMFKKYESRTFWSHAHLWLGRFVITLGIVNGGLGFNLADSLGMGSRTGMIVYSVVAGIIWLVWVAAIIIGERRRKTMAARSLKHTENPNTEMAPTSERADIPYPEHGHYAPK